MSVLSIVQEAVRTRHFTPSPTTSNVAMNGPGKGTTIIGFSYDNEKAVLMASDRMTACGSYIYSMTEKKIHLIGTNLALAGCGLVAHIQIMADLLQTVSRRISFKTGRELTALGKADIFKSILECLPEPPEAGFILAGHDALRREKNSIVLRAYDCVGGAYVGSHLCDGSGGEQATTVLDQNWNQALSQNEAIVLAIRTLFQASKRIMSTASPCLSPITIALATAQGVHFVPEEKIIKLIEKYAPGFLKRQRANDVRSELGS